MKDEETSARPSQVPADKLRAKELFMKRPCFASVIAVGLMFLLGCGAGTGGKTMVTITGAPASLVVNTSANLGVTIVHNAKSGTGVVWTLTGTGLIGTFTNMTPYNVTYNAPLAVPTPNTVTITATSIFDPTATNSVVITITP
jgi:hypothetical protein